MEISCFLIVSEGKKRYSPNIKIVKSLKGNMPSNAVAIKVNLNLPDSIFKKPQLQATIKIDESDVSKPVIDAKVLDNIKAEMSKYLGIDMSINIVEPKQKK